MPPCVFEQHRNIIKHKIKAANAKTQQYLFRFSIVSRVLQNLTFNIQGCLLCMKDSHAHAAAILVDLACTNSKPETPLIMEGPAADDHALVYPCVRDGKLMPVLDPRLNRSDTIRFVVPELKTNSTFKHQVARCIFACRRVDLSMKRQLGAGFQNLSCV